MDIVKRVEAALTRVDGWVNLITGVGTDRRSKRLSFTADPILPDEMLERLYIDDAYARRICRVVPQEALRQGATVATGDEQLDAALTERLDGLAVNVQLRQAWTWARVFGGGAVFVGADDGRDPREPLDETAIRSVHFLDALDRRELVAFRYHTDPRAPLFGLPETYLLQRAGGGGAHQHAVVHRSRLIIFDGAPTTRRRRQELKGWGDSELQCLYAKLSDLNGAFEATGTLLQQASESVFTMKNLMAMMAADKKDTLKTRLEMMDLARGVTRSVLLDEGETYTRTEVGALTGVAQTMDKFLLWLSGACEIPVTILMGQAPAGLSATGDSDVRWFYDRVKSAQTEVLLPNHRRLVRLLLLAKDSPSRGALPSKLTIEYPPLWQPTPGEVADQRQKQAQTDATYIDKGVVTPEEVAVSRFGKGGYSAETTIDLDARAATQAADRDAAALTSGQEGAPGADHAEGVAGIIAKVAAREIPRDAGVALLQTSMGLAPDVAEATMGEAGRSFFTTPEPGHAAEMDALQEKHRALEASARGARQMLARVLERNRNGELVIGSPIARAPTELAEGEELAEGDVVEVPVEDGRFEVRRVDGRSNGVAVVLQLPPEHAASLPTRTPPEDLHVTLAFLGLNDRWSSDAIDRVVGAVRQWALSVPPIAATLGGIGRFPAGPDGEPVYVPVDSEVITSARPALVAFLRAAGFGVAKGHGFTPHLTLDYLAAGAPTPPPVLPVKVVFSRVSVWWADTRVDVELGGDADA